MDRNAIHSRYPGEIVLRADDTQVFGVGGSNGSPNTLYFTDGINSEMDGLFGAICRREGP